EHDEYWAWLNWPLTRYTQLHPEIVNRVSSNARVFVPRRPDVTVPQPDFAAYENFPRRLALARATNWRRVSPILVVEIMSPDSTDKDLFRNVELYEAVPSIREYWVVDGRGEVEEMVFRVYRKRGSKWQKPIDYHYGDTYRTRLLPGFSLLIDPLA